MTTITMIDYGGSNIRSVQKALEYVGAQTRITANPEDILRAEKLVLPGVGAFGAGMTALRERGLDTAVTQAAQQNIPLLGICLGMQFLFDESNEMGTHKGLGLIPGQVTRFPEKSPMALNAPASRTANRQSLKIPHMGWNQIEHGETHPLLASIPSGSYAYFVHSYYCLPANPDDGLAFTDYGLRFTSIVGHGRIFGIQFHPEKSQQVGLRILQNFVNM
ncbi:MAG: imidazole glycerol phosphate synthase subunit HisH [Candidatus Promineifilaceae bacterium]